MQRLIIILRLKNKKQVAEIKYTIAILCRTPGIRIVFQLNSGNPFRKIPSRKNKRLRFPIFSKTENTGLPKNRYLEKEIGIAKPIIKRKKGRPRKVEIFKEEIIPKKK